MPIQETVAKHSPSPARSLRVVVSRDGVDVGDDPFSTELMVPDETTLEQMGRRLLASYRLPRLTSDDTTWVLSQLPTADAPASGVRPLVVFTQQLDGPLFVFPPRTLAQDLVVERGRDRALRLHFRYAPKVDPHDVVRRYVLGHALKVTSTLATVHTGRRLASVPTPAS